MQAVEPEPLRETSEAVGTVRSRTQTLIASKVLGYVREVRAREGDTVRAGQLLVLVEEREFATRVDRARAALQEATLGLDEVRRTLEEAEAALGSAEAERRYAEATATRYRKLLDQELIGGHEFEGIEAKRKSAEAAVEQARARILSVRAREEQAQQRIKQGRAELASTEIALNDARITAPMSGLVVEKKVSTGNLAVPGQPLLVIEDAEHYRLEAVVGESAMRWITLGQAVRVVLDAPARTIEGRVVQVIPAADPASRSVTVKIDLAPTPGLRSGTFGRARFPADERPALLVPARALVERGQLTSVFAVDGSGVARLRLVTIGQRHDDRVEVLSGLNRGERIVTEGAERVTDGSRVQAAR